jgi:hypothetical protein
MKGPSPLLIRRLIDRRDRLTVTIDCLQSEFAVERGHGAMKKARRALDLLSANGHHGGPRPAIREDDKRRRREGPTSTGRRLTLAERRAISKRMKKRWAEWRAARGVDTLKKSVEKTAK